MARKSQYSDEVLAEDGSDQPRNVAGQPVQANPEDLPKCELCGQPEDAGPDAKDEDKMGAIAGHLLHPRCRQEWARRRREKDAGRQAIEDVKAVAAPTTYGSAQSEK